MGGEDAVEVRVQVSALALFWLGFLSLCVTANLALKYQNKSLMCPNHESILAEIQQVTAACLHFTIKTDIPYL